MISEHELNRRLALLKTEVELDFDDLVPALEGGLQFVLVTDPRLGKDLDSDVLRRIGGMVMLCDHYGAAVLFVHEKKFGELNSTGSFKR